MINGDAIDTFLLSCRILGKGIEKAFLTAIMMRLSQDGVEKLHAEYIPTAKNAQVADFYDKMQFEMTYKGTDGAKQYEINLRNKDLSVKDYYQIIWK